MSAHPVARTSGHTSIEAFGRQLAAAVLSLRATAGELAGLNLDAAASATVLGLLEQAHRAIAFGQLHATFQADASQVHRLDPDTALRIDMLAAHPEGLADGTAHVPAEVLRQGMAPQRNTQAYLQAHLHISNAEARSRLAGARLLIAPAPPDPDDPTSLSDGTAEPSYPILAEAAADGSADVATLAQLAGRLDSMAPRIIPRPDARQVTTAIEESLANEARTGDPKTCHKALQDWKEFLSDHGSAITDEEILARRGLFYRGFRDGCDEFLLRCDPIDSEVIRSFGEAWSNPRSQKSPPRSASTKPRSMSMPAPAIPGATKLPAPAEPASTEPAPAERGRIPIPGSTGVPLGTPIPEWAIAPGTPAELIPVSQLECGAPPRDIDTCPAAGPPDSDETPTAEPAESDRTTPQLLLDALVGACSGVLEGKGLSQSGGLRVRVGVTIDYRSLLGQLEEAGLTDHGRPVSALRIRAMACSGGLLPVVLGSTGEVLDMGREVRGFTAAQHKALAIRDRGCVVPGCHRPAATGEAHHVRSWLDGGPTDVGNGCIVCQYHHLAVHAGLITLRMIDGIPYVIARAGEPRGEPERNLFWHPELRTAGYTSPLFT